MDQKTKQQIERRRTFAIISHPDAGKTTLTEKLLLYGGAIQSAGSVKGKQGDKHAASDWMEIEKQRGISVTSSAMQFDFNGYRGFSYGYNEPEYLLNLKVAKSIKSFTVSLSAYDILGSAKSFSHTASAEYIEDTYRNNIGRCILVGLSYNFGTWDFVRKHTMQSIEKRNEL